MIAKKELFESTPVPEAIWKLALPAVLGQIILVLYNMADTFFVGLTGSDAMLSAVTICMPAFMFLSAVANLFGIGGASVIARAMGDGDTQKAGYASAFALWGCLGVTALYSLCAYIWADPFIDLLGGTDPQVHALAREYLFCTVTLGGLPTAVATLLSHLIRSEGRSLHASAGIALGGLLNMALDPLFMFVLLPAGREVLGAAVATSLSNVFALLYFVWVLIRKRKRSCLSFIPGKAMLSQAVPAGVLAAGLPACLMTLFENISFAVLDALMAVNGISFQAGLGVAKKVNMLAHCMVRGMAQGVLPLIGYTYASGDHQRMKKTVSLSMGISVGLAALCTIVCLLWSRPLIGLFIRHGSDSVRYGADFLRILCLGAPFSACAYTCISFFQATGKGMRSFFLAVFRKGVLDIPLMFLLRTVSPVYGMVWATPVTDGVCCVLSLVLFAVFLRAHTNLFAPAPKEEAIPASGQKVLCS